MVDGEPATAEVYSGLDPRGNPMHTLRLIEIRAAPIGWPGDDGVPDGGVESLEGGFCDLGARAAVRHSGPVCRVSDRAKRLARSMVVLAVAAALAAAPGVFRDTMGLFALPLPDGWTGKLAGFGQAEFHSRGGASAMAMFLPEAAEKPQMVDKLKQDFQKNHRLLRTAKTHVFNGLEATAEIYEGKLRDGRPEVIRMVYVPAGTGVGLFLIERPTAEWDRWKADFTTREHGVRFAVQPKGGKFVMLPKD